MPLSRDVCAALAIGAATSVVAALAAERTYLTFGTETDFLGMFLPAAKQVGSGGPLLLAFHPPLYPAVLARAHRFIGDWMSAGLVISALAFGVGLGASYALFRVIGQCWAAWGALLALATSPLYLQFGAQVTSDAFFFSLYALALLLVALAWRAGTLGAWFVAGIVMGLTTLTRTNGVSVLLLAAAPLAQVAERRTRLWRAVAAAAGAGVTLGVWGAIALATESPVWPTQNAYNLALTYLAPGTDRMTHEAAAVLPDSLPGIGELLLNQPGMVARTYAHDAFDTLMRLLRGEELTLLPVGVLLVPGLVLLLRSMDRRLALVLAAATVLQAAMVNLKAFEGRYFMFALPLIGAGAAAVAKAAWGRLDGKGVRLAAAALPAGVAGIALLAALREVRAELHAQDVELSEAAPVVRQMVEPGGAIAARKGHLAFYGGAKRARLPAAATLDELRAGLGSIPDRPLYLFYGSSEERLRPKLRALLSPDSAPPWLDPVAESPRRGAWVLYRFVPVPAAD
jgi:hypothetical protein